MKRLLFLSAILLSAALGKAQSCPNGDFESWNTINNFGPDSGWYNSNAQSLSLADTLTVWSVTGYIGQGIHIETAITAKDSLQAWITNSYGDPSRGRGGVPYSQQPTGITGYYRYSLGAGDSAGLFVGFKKNGSVISTNLFKIRNSTGSISTFTAFTYTLATLSVVPDTMFIAATSSNIFSNYMVGGSWIELDELAFTGPGITQGIPDGNFEGWANTPLMNPTGWQTQANFNSTGVSQTTDHYSGSYAVQLQTIFNGGGSGSGNNLSSGHITTGTMTQHSSPTGGLPYSRISDTLYGYYKYAPVGSDTADIQVSLTHTGAFVGGNTILLPSASSWTLFSIPFSCTSTPDTILIDIYSSNYPSWNGNQIAATGPGSTLKVDHLYLSSQPLGIEQYSMSQNSVLVYPDPANDVLNFRIDDPVSGNLDITIYDLTGRVLDSRHYDQLPHLISLPVGYLQTGIYFYEVKNNKTVIRDKFFKE